MRPADWLTPSRTHAPSPWRHCVRVLLYTFIAAAPVAHAQIVVDGRLDEPEWQSAFHCGDWLRTQPFALDTPRYSNDLYLVSTERGLAAAFVVSQPQAEQRI